MRKASGSLDLIGFFLRYNIKINLVWTVVPESKRAGGQARRKCSSDEEVPAGKDRSYKEFASVTGISTKAQQYLARLLSWLETSFSDSIFYPSKQINYLYVLSGIQWCN